jgi:O-antigen ligase
MSTWLPPPGMLSRRDPRARVMVADSAHRRFKPRAALWLGSLICVLVAEGVAITHSYLWAAPLLGVLVVAVAIEIPLVGFLTLILLVRVLTDASLSSASTRHTGSLNLSAGIAFLLMLIGIGLLLRRRRGLWPVSAIALFLCVSTAIAVGTHGASTATLREGVRELSIIALGVIVYNSREVLNVSVVTRLVQVVGIGSALVALYQLTAHSGVLINGEIRSNGTFIHPNGAAMYFAIATTASLWRYFECGRRRSDALFAATYAAATISTFSFTGLAGLLAMLMTYGALRPGSFRLKAGTFAVATLIVVGFLATPLGAQRLENETSTRLNSGSAQNEMANTSFAWRVDKWRTLIPKWEQAPLVGQGLGTTVTEESAGEAVSANGTIGSVPHNEYLRYLVETGAIGLMILLWAIVLLVRSLARRRGTFDGPDAGTLGIAIVVGCLVNALADNTILYTTTGYAAALIVAAVLTSPCRKTSRPVTNVT